MPRFHSLPPQTNLSDVFMKFPETVPPLLDYHDILLRGPSELSILERELIAAYVSGLNACGFCFGAHSIIAESFGLKQTVLAQLLKSIDDTTEIDDKLKPILHYVRKLTLTPTKLTDKDADLVFVHGWSEAALNTVIQVTALFNFMNRIIEGHGVETNDTIQAAQRERNKNNSSSNPSPTFYRDYGRMLGVYPSRSSDTFSSPLSLLDQAITLTDRHKRTHEIVSLVKSGETLCQKPDLVVAICDTILSLVSDELLEAKLIKLKLSIAVPANQGSEPAINPVEPLAADLPSQAGLLAQLSDLWLTPDLTKEPSQTVEEIKPPKLNLGN